MVISRTPLRISFVGGGTDLPSFSDAHGGAVVSTTIDKYIYVIVSERFEESIRVSYSRTEIVDRIDELEHELVREALRLTGIPRKVEIVTVADVPSQGTGLGSSSAVTVGVLNALFAYQGILKSPEELAEYACHLEIDVLGKPIGRQDQYACACGGMQLLRFQPQSKVRRDPVITSRAVAQQLERNLLMFYTGQQRAAGDILTKMNADAGQRTLDKHLEPMRDLALGLFDELGRGAQADVLGPFLDENWKLKRQLSETVSDVEVDDLHERGMRAGALGGKLLGAGGGGFLLFYVPDEHKPAIRKELRELRELPFRFEQEGSRIILV